MARPKNTKSTKWVIKHESWHNSRKDALASVNDLHLPYEVKNMEGSKTMFGNYRRATWRARTFIPSLYRGQKMRAGPWYPKPKKDFLKKYHFMYPLVKIRGGAWIVLEGSKSAMMRRANAIMKKIEMRQAAQRAGKDAIRKLSRM